MRFPDFPVSRWLLDEWARRSFPVPVLLNRLTAPLLLFIFGMKVLSSPLIPWDKPRGYPP
jgi:hypothetical protein